MSGRMLQHCPPRVPWVVALGSEGHVPRGCTWGKDTGRPSRLTHGSPLDRSPNARNASDSTRQTMQADRGTKATKSACLLAYRHLRTVSLRCMRGPQPRLVLHYCCC